MPQNEDDFSNDPHKEDDYRADTLRWLWDAGENIWAMDAAGKKTRRFVGSVCDLSGRTAESIRFFEKEGVLGPKGLVLVDTKYEYIHNNRKAYPHPSYKFVAGDIFDNWNGSEFDDVNVWLLDLYNELASPVLDARALDLRARVSRSVERFDECAVIVNASVDAVVRRRGTPSEKLWEHARVLSKALSYSVPRRVVDPEMIVRQEDCEKLDDPDFVGPLGCFQVYRCRAQRMANFRLILM